MPKQLPAKPTSALLFSAGLLLAGLAPAFSCHAAFAQGITTGTIIGSVTDASGAVIPGATVSATRAATGIKLSATADQKGAFSFRNVPSGTYTVSIVSSGFAAAKVDNVKVDTGQTSDLGATKLGMGASSTNVEVSESTAPLLQTTESQVSTTFSAVQTEDLPLNGSLDNLALLTPGVAIGHDAAFSNSSGFNLSINGQRSRSNNYEIDGQSNNDNSVAGPQIFFANQDAIQEVQVVTSNYNAVYGRNMGGIINYVTKSGTNRFHGTGYEFYTGSFLSSFANGYKSPLLGYCAPGQTPSDTNSCTTPVLPRYVENRWGGTFGGPVLKDKLWFFGGTNWDHQRQGSTPYVTSNLTPTPAGLQALSNAFPGNPAVAALAAQGPLSLAGAVATGTAATRLVTGPNGVSVRIPFSQAQIPVTPLYNDQEDIGRLDWQPGQKDHFFLRYIYQDSVNQGAQLTNGYFYNVPNTVHSIGADWAHTFSSNWVNQLRYGFQQSKLFFQGGTQPNCASTSLDSCITSVSIPGSVGFGYPTNLPQGRTVKVTQVQDNANWTRGHHSVAFGGDYTYQNSPNTFLPSYNGGYSFSNFNNYIQGTGTLSLGDGNPVIPFTENDFGLYAQDNWKVLPSLTLNLGFRYEFFGQPVNNLNSETVARETGPNPFWDTALPLSARTYPQKNRNWKNLEPRLGFAFNPDSLKNLVVRGAYGIQYDPSFYNIFLNSATAAPVVNLGTIQCTGNCLPGGNLSGANVRALNLPRLPRGVNPSYRNQTNNPAEFVNPRAQTYSLGVQYQLRNAVLGVSYIGNHVSRQFQSLNANPYLSPVARAFPGVVSPASLCQDTTKPLGIGRLSCDAGNVLTRQNSAFSNYNSLQVQLQTRQYKGATINASYTYSRVIDNTDEIFSATSPAGTSTSPAYAQNPLQADVPERGVANYSYPNLASIGINYQVPAFLRQSGLRGRLLGGYEVSTNWNFNNGETWTPSQFYSALTFTDPTATAVTNMTSYCDPKFNARVGTDTCRPVLANSRAPVSTVGVYVVDPTHAFTTNGTGFYQFQSTDAKGNLNAPINKSDVHWLFNNQAYANLVGNPYDGSPRNITRGQSYNNLDAAVIKTTSLTEGVSVKLYLNSFNVLNRAFLGNPDTAIGDSSFGSNRFNTGSFSNGGTTLPAARAFQVGGKVIF